MGCWVLRERAQQHHQLPPDACQGAAHTLPRPAAVHLLPTDPSVTPLALPPLTGPCLPAAPWGPHRVCHPHSPSPAPLTHVSQHPTPMGCRQVHSRQLVLSHDSPRANCFPSYSQGAVKRERWQ